MSEWMVLNPTTLLLNTGVPQRSILSYTSSSPYTQTKSPVIATDYFLNDDMAWVACLTDEGSLSTMVLCFQESSLELNISKTKKLCCRGHWAPDTPRPLSGTLRLEGQVVEQVEIFKYLGTEIDHCLSLAQHADRFYKKCTAFFSHSTLHPATISKARKN